MFVLNLQKPCTLSVQGFTKVIDNDTKEIFYQTIKGQKYFCLPQGNFTISQSFKKLPFNRKFIFTPIKEREKNYFFKEFAPLKFSKNPNVATVYHEKKEIVFDNKLKEQPFLFQAFILYHEIGHKYFNTEWKCDVFACHKLLNSGYNQSQILKVCENFLSVKHKERFKHCQSVIKKSSLLIPNTEKK